MRVELSVPFSIQEVSNTTIPPAFDSFIVSSITTDSRIAQHGDLFIALDGEKYRGSEFIDEAINKGCLCVTESERSDSIIVDDTALFLLRIASYYKSRLKKLKHTIAITGSVGKSTTKEITKHIIGSAYKIHATDGNMNNHIGLPLTILSAPEDTEILILEMGMNHSGEIRLLSDCAKPDIAVITGIGTSHIGNLGTRENIAKAKLEITDGMSDGIILVPHKEPLLFGIKNSMSVSLNDPSADFNLNIDDESYLDFVSRFGEINKINCNISAKHILSDLSFGISAALLAGMNAGAVKKAIESFSSVDFRQRFIQLKNYTLFDDSYNSSFESLIADFEMLSSIADKDNRPLGAFIGDILELGELGPYIHYRVGRHAIHYGIRSLYLYGKLSEYTAKGAIDAGFDPSRIYINTNTDAPEISIDQIINHHLQNELILIKGSHKLKMNIIAETIEFRERNKNDRL